MGGEDGACVLNFLALWDDFLVSRCKAMAKAASFFYYINKSPALRLRTPDYGPGLFSEFQLFRFPRAVGFTPPSPTVVPLSPAHPRVVGRASSSGVPLPPLPRPRIRVITVSCFNHFDLSVADVLGWTPPHTPDGRS